MDYFAPVQTELKSQINQIQNLANQSLEAKENWIKEKIKDRWLLGIDPSGNKIGFYRSSEYAGFKSSINNKAGLGNVDLTLTGALGRGIKVKGFNTGLEIYSTDSKYDEITEKYGDYNFNLSDEVRDELFNEVLSEILNEVINQSYALL